MAYQAHHYLGLSSLTTAAVCWSCVTASALLATYVQRSSCSTFCVSHGPLPYRLGLSTPNRSQPIRTTLNTHPCLLARGNAARPDFILWSLGLHMEQVALVQYKGSFRWPRWHFNRIIALAHLSGCMLASLQSSLY